MTNKENPDIQEEKTAEEDLKTEDKAAEDKATGEKSSEQQTDEKDSGSNDFKEKAEEDDSEEKNSEEPENSEDDSSADKGNHSDEEDEDLKTKHLRLMADFQNYKRRAEEARMKSYSNGREDMLTELLPVIDNFERALETEDEQSNGFKEGMEMIFKQLMEVLTKAGLEEIKAQGEEFDPNFHNAVMTEDTDEFESNHVTEVLQKGYVFKEKVIRPSMVKVAN